MWKEITINYVALAACTAQRTKNEAEPQTLSPLGHINSNRFKAVKQNELTVFLVFIKTAILQLFYLSLRLFLLFK